MSEKKQDKKLALKKETVKKLTVKTGTKAGCYRTTCDAGVSAATQ